MMIYRFNLLCRESVISFEFAFLWAGKGGMGGDLIAVLSRYIKMGMLERSFKIGNVNMISSLKGRKLLPYVSSLAYDYRRFMLSYSN